MIYLGSDHAGFALKQEVKKMLDEMKLDYRDLGNKVEEPTDDYPEYAFAVGEAVAKEPGAVGILLCGTAQGVCLAANKVRGVRAVTAHHALEAQRTREHNDANVLCLSGWEQSAMEVKPVIGTFLSAKFTGEERHVRRLKKISDYEQGSGSPLPRG